MKITEKMIVTQVGFARISERIHGSRVFEDRRVKLESLFHGTDVAALEVVIGGKDANELNLGDVVNVTLEHVTREKVGEIGQRGVVGDAPTPAPGFDPEG